jgi:two-component system, NarL family, invasion response regulator UvrY
MMRKILVVDDHAIVRKGIALILKNSPRVEAICEEASSEREAEQKIAKEMYDMVLFSVPSVGGNCLEFPKKLIKQHPNLPIVILSMLPPENRYRVQALKLGAVSHLSKNSSPEELALAVEMVLSGGGYVSSSLEERLGAHHGMGLITKALPHEKLSNREFQVLQMMGEGQSPTQIACALVLSIKTVSTYRSRILQKMRMRNNAELLHYIFKNNLLYSVSFP